MSSFAWRASTSVAVHARRAVGEERDRLWRRWAEIDLQLDGYAGLRTIETPVVVLEPRDGAEPHQP